MTGAVRGTGGKIGVLALQGDVREHVQALAELGAHAVEVRVPEDLTAVDALVLPGGESTTIAKLLDFSGLFGPVADRRPARLRFRRADGSIPRTRGA